jgi:hypothetical protein
MQIGSALHWMRASYPEAREAMERIMTEDDPNKKKAEQRITDELARQPKQENGNAEEEQSKERRAQAEKELRNAE